MRRCTTKFDDDVSRARSPSSTTACTRLQKFVVRRWLLDDGKRVDGRGIDEMRPLAAEVGLLPRVHGSGMFTRGQTQVHHRGDPGLRPAMLRCWTASTTKTTSGICIITISRPTPWARPSPPAAPAAGKSATALLAERALLPGDPLGGGVPLHHASGV